MSKLKEIFAESKSELLSILSNIDVKVPARTTKVLKGRRTDYTEKWSICHMLSTYANENLLMYPLKLNHRVDNEPPDFKLALDTKEIGVEFTEAIPEQYAWALALNENIPEGVIEPSFFRLDSSPKTGKEIIDIMKKSSQDLYAIGERGNSAEIEWAKGMWFFILKKLKKLNKFDFTKFSENWLLIYDNMPGPCDLSKAGDYLKGKMIQYWNGFSDYQFIFNRILIERSKYFLTIDSSDIKIVETYSLW